MEPFIDVLQTAAERWHTAREYERLEAAEAHKAIRLAAAEGIAEAEIARIMRIDRQTVRRALGKR